MLKAYFCIPRPRGYCVDMRSIHYLAIVMILCLAGCGRNDPAVLAEKATFDALAPDYLLFTDQDKTNDPKYTPADSARAQRTIDTWRLRLDEELKTTSP